MPPVDSNNSSLSDAHSSTSGSTSGSANNSTNDGSHGKDSHSKDGHSKERNNTHEWINTAIPAGSGRYYALLHTDPALQHQQQLISTLISIFSKLCFQSREVEVVKHKVDWWRQELEKDQFSHPVTDALDSLNTVKRKQLSQLLNGYATLLESGSPSTDEQNKQFHLNTGAAACHLLCSSETSNNAVTEAGVVLSRFRCLRYLRQHVDCGLLCIPMSSLDAANISPALLTPAASNEEVDQYLANELATIDQQIQTSLQSLTSLIKDTAAGESDNYKALYVYLVLQHKLLQVMRKDNTSVVSTVTRLTPIRNFWHAYGAARKFNKLAK